MITLLKIVIPSNYKKFSQNLPNYFWDKEKIKQQDVLKINKLKEEIFIYCKKLEKLILKIFKKILK